MMPVAAGKPPPALGALEEAVPSTARSGQYGLDSTSLTNLGLKLVSLSQSFLGGLLLYC